MESDNLFFHLGLAQCEQVPQLLYKHEKGELVLIAAKIVEDIKVAGKSNNAQQSLDNLKKKFKLGSVANGPGKSRFFGINATQEEDMTSSTDADDKPDSLSEYSLSRYRKKNFDDSNACSELVIVDVETQLCADSKDLFTSLSTQKNSIDGGIRGDFASIRFEFQVGNIDLITWIPGKADLADPSTKKDSALSEALQLTMYTGKLPFYFNEASETKSAGKHYG